MKVYKVHQRFRETWREYENKDLIAVCKFVLKGINVGIKGDGLSQITTHWANVCNFLYKWEGKNK